MDFQNKLQSRVDVLQKEMRRLAENILMCESASEKPSLLAKYMQCEHDVDQLWDLLKSPTDRKLHPQQAVSNDTADVVRTAEDFREAEWKRIREREGASAAPRAPVNRPLLPPAYTEESLREHVTRLRRELVE